MTSAKVRELCYLNLLDAWKVASKSKDPSTQLGAILLSANYFDEHRKTDLWEVQQCNHFAPGTHEICWHAREAKYKKVIHAEEAVIYLAAKMGLSTAESTLVCGWACCLRCARAIVGAGVRNLVIDAAAMRRSPERWRESIEEGHEYLRENGVFIYELERPDRMFKVPTLFDGEMWREEPIQ